MSSYFSRSSLARSLLASATLAAALLAGCGAPPPAKRASVRIPRIQPAAGWVGTYSGTVSCSLPTTSGCTAQQLTLTLLPNNTYQLDTTVLRHGQPYTISSSGRLQWDESGRIITLASKDENARLLVSNKTLQRLPGNTDVDVDPAIYKGSVLHKQ